MSASDPCSSGPTARAPSRRCQWLVGATASLFLFTLLILFRSDAVGGLYYQPWPSERLMQTVALQDLQDAPWETITHLHVHPPALDSLRALLVACVPGAGETAAHRFVDGSLLGLGVLAYGFLAWLVFRWTARLAGLAVGLAAALVAMLHPASIFYATMLDTTFVTAALTVVLLYGLWRSADGGWRSVALVAAAYIALFYTRSLYQWPFPFVLAGALLLRGVTKRRVLVFLAVTVVASGAYMAEQVNHFGTPSTSTFIGFNLVRSVGIDDTDAYLALMDGHTDSLSAGLPPALGRRRVRGGYPNFNHADYLDEYRHLMSRWWDHIRTTPVSRTLRDYAFNLWLYIQPSSRYTRHAVVDRLPWRRWMDRLFAFPPVILLWLTACATWVLGLDGRRDWMRAAGMALPVLLIVTIAVVCERGENMRYKFFLEPASIVFIAAQGHRLWLRLRRPAH